MRAVVILVPVAGLLHDLLALLDQSSLTVDLELERPSE